MVIECIYYFWKEKVLVFKTSTWDLTYLMKAGSVNCKLLISHLIIVLANLKSIQKDLKAQHIMWERTSLYTAYELLSCACEHFSILSMSHPDSPKYSVTLCLSFAWVRKIYPEIFHDHCLILEEQWKIHNLPLMFLCISQR